MENLFNDNDLTLWDKYIFLYFSLSLHLFIKTPGEFRSSVLIVGPDHSEGIF